MSAIMMALNRVWYSCVFHHAQLCAIASTVTCKHTIDLIPKLCTLSRWCLPAIISRRRIAQQSRGKHNLLFLCEGMTWRFKRCWWFAARRKKEFLWISVRTSVPIEEAAAQQSGSDIHFLGSSWWDVEKTHEKTKAAGRTSVLQVMTVRCYSALTRYLIRHHI